MLTQRLNYEYLSDDGGSSLGAVLPVWSKDPAGLVVTSKAVDTGLGENEAVLGADVVAGPLEVLTDVDSTADEVVKLLWECWSKTIGAENADNLAAGNKTDCTNGMAITKEITDLRWANTLLGVITDSLDALLRCHLEPVWSCTTVREGRAGDTLSIAVESSHYKGRPNLPS